MSKCVRCGRVEAPLLYAMADCTPTGFTFCRRKALYSGDAQGLSSPDHAQYRARILAYRP